MKDKLVEDFISDLLEKSEEAYLLALEIINKPTISYRTEGFCFFICNAWELLLKARLISQTNSIDAIFFKDKPNRTLSLSTVMEKIFTSTSHSLRDSLSLIIEIRNRTTHFILKEYDYSLVPLFQSVVSSYHNFFCKHFPSYNINDSMTPFISINIERKIESNTLSLIGDGAEFLKTTKETIESNGLGIKYSYYIVKKETDANFNVAINNVAGKNVKLVNVPKDIKTLYPYNHSRLVKQVSQMLIPHLGNNHGFTTNSLNRISKDNNAKQNQNWSYELPYTEKSKIFMYSSDYLIFLVDHYIEDEFFRLKYCKKKKNN